MKILLVLTTLLVALIAGLMFSYAVSVNIGLRRLPDMQYLQAMQHINRAILNPWFMISFAGPIFLYAASGWITYKAGGMNTLFLLICASAVVYVFGVFIVTGAKNVPLNEALDKLVLDGNSKEFIQNQRQLFEGPWNNFHMVRTIASIVSLVLMLLALIRVR